ncbi:retrotransposon protein [Hordeum vulgare]|nr:retrotransposon protein [Hordeum vulgare]
MWERDPKLPDIISKAWARSRPGGDLGNVSASLKTVMADLRTWSKENFGQMEKQVATLQKELENLQLNDADRVLIRQKMQQLDELLYREEMMWLQRSRIVWLKEGDRNTKYFHRQAVWRVRRNNIRRLQKEDGSWCNSPSEMERMAASYFKEVYTKDPTLDPVAVLDVLEPKVSADTNEHLLVPYSDTEISDALFQIRPLKAPGPDGFPSRFYQRNWSCMKEEIIKAVRQFFVTGHMPEGVNDTCIVLIPKVQHPSSLKDFWPISLCNVIYKIVSKCMVNRLRPCLSELISENQSAFIRGRLISDNSIIAFECIHHIQSSPGSTDFCAYKLDLSKAYDRVDWDYLELALLKWGFAPRWVALVMECVRSVRYSVKFNGRLLQQFSPTRGIQQGDPLSPFLFLFVADSLSSLLHVAGQQRGLEAIKICRRAPAISHLLFADDSLLFFRASAESATIVKDVLNTYASVTSQLINPSKCSILFAESCSTQVAEDVKQILGVTQQAFEPKYLGLPVPEGRMHKGRFESLQSRLSKCLVDWSERYSSFASKEVLIKAVAQAIPVYVMSIFKLPLCVCDD